MLSAGDRLELRGPIVIGGHFVWDVTLGGPLLLVAGGSGIMPLMAMLRHRAAALGENRTLDQGDTGNADAESPISHDMLPPAIPGWRAC